MPTNFAIIHDLDLVYVRVEGAVIVDESRAMMHQYLQHPDYKPNRQHLHDLSRITIAQIEYPSVVALQNQVMTQQQTTPSQNHVVYYAPTSLSQSVAEDLKRLWAHFANIHITITHTIEDAAAQLDLPEPAIKSLTCGAFPA